jgi:threonine dehydrogenase-like Zn-dependent dehydrogenase
VGSRNSRKAFTESIELVSAGRIDVTAMISRTISFEEAPDAVREIATYPEKFMKVVALL